MEMEMTKARIRMDSKLLLLRTLCLLGVAIGIWKGNAHLHHLWPMPISL